MNHVEFIYQKPKYNAGPNDGHHKDPLQREYISSKEIIQRDIQVPENVELFMTNRGVYYSMKNDQYINESLREYICWENDLISRVEKFIKASRTILDIGSHIGTHSISYSLLNSEARIYSFEIQKPIYELFQKNIKLNKCTNIIPHLFAIGHLNDYEVSVKQTFVDGDSYNKPITYHNGSSPMNYGGVQVGIGDTKVTMRTIDSFDFQNVDFIKVDIEGCEKLAFWGARQTIEKYKPVILYEDRPDKQITDDMRQIMEIPDKIHNFDIKKYCMELGYRILMRIGCTDALLIP